MTAVLPKIRVLRR